MESIYKSLPFFKNCTPITESEIYKRLNDAKDGRAAQKLLVECEAGMSPEDFGKRAKTATFKKAVAALGKAHGDASRDITIRRLKNTARMFYRLKRHDGTIPWKMYAEKFRCLKLLSMDPDECRGQVLPCNSVLTKHFGSVLETILFRHELLSKDGGIFAERLITAVELGVPFHRIKRSQDINLPAAMEILKEYYPECTEEWLEELSKLYERDWEKEPVPPQSK